MRSQLPELIRSLKDKFEISIPDAVSEEEILHLLEQRVSYLIEHNPEEFFQLMYRIDIPESQLADVLTHADAIKDIARVIYDRQLEKVRSRMKYRSYFENTGKDDELKW